jgi:hypothetical protein
MSKCKCQECQKAQAIFSKDNNPIGMEIQIKKPVPYAARAIGTDDFEVDLVLYQKYKEHPAP